MEDGPGYKGKRLYLTKIKEEQDIELLSSLRRRTYPLGQEKPGPRFLVFFQVDKIPTADWGRRGLNRSLIFRKQEPTAINKERPMAKVNRITPEETYQKLREGNALLVCAYDSEEQFRSRQLAGAISLPEFRAKLSSLSKDQEIVFYCA
jgi:hypothetical protein